jgi:hypothetical protein
MEIGEEEKELQEKQRRLHFDIILTEQPDLNPDLPVYEAAFDAYQLYVSDIRSFGEDFP